MSQENAPFFVDTEVIRLTRSGVWMSDGTEITHEPARRLFARSLKRDDQGWILCVGRETKRIEVEDTAYFIHRVDGTPDEGYLLWLNDETLESLDPGTLLYRPGRLTCRLGRGEEARFLHSAYIDLLRGLSEDEQGYFLRVQGSRFTLAPSS